MSKDPIVKYEETIIPKYKYVEKEIEVPKLKEVEVESLSKESLDRLKEAEAYLTNIYAHLQKIKSYRIEEVPIKVEKPEYIKKEFIDPVLKKKEIMFPEYKLVEKTIEVPRIIEKPVEGISSRDLNLIREYVEALKELKSFLESVKNYKIKEEIIRVEVPKLIPKPVEVKTEKVIFDTKVISSLEEFIKEMKK